MHKKETIIILVITLIIVLGLSLIYKFNIYKFKEVDNYNFKIYFFNAGKADAILISKNNKYIMIDTGEESLSNEILRYFKENNITRLEYLIITHFDKDHVGSASSIIDNIEIGKLEYLIITHFDKDHVGSASNIIDNIEIGSVLQSNYPKESEYYTNYLNSLDVKNIEPVTVTGNYDISFDDLAINVNGPSTTYENNESNNSSLIVSIKNGENKFLFMGDSENARIKDFINDNKETYDFIKIPYHGYYLKRLGSLLENIDAKYGVMTCSSNLGCEEETINVLNNYNVKYYMTKNRGISVLSDGENIIINQ